MKPSRRVPGSAPTNHEMKAMERNDIRMQLVMSVRQRRLLQVLADREHRSLNGMMRALIERAAGQMEATGVAKSTSHADGRAV